MDWLDVLPTIGKTFLKIIVIDIKTDTYHKIKVDPQEIILGCHFSEWWKRFADCGVYPDDREKFLNFINVFKDNTTVFYRRKTNGDSWRWTAAHFIEMDCSTAMEPKYLLLVKDCNFGIIKALSEKNLLDQEDRIIKDNNRWQKIKKNNTKKYYLYLIESNDIESIIEIFKQYNVPGDYYYHVKIKRIIILDTINPKERQELINSIKSEIQKKKVKYSIGLASDTNLDNALNYTINHLISN